MQSIHPKLCLLATVAKFNGSTRNAFSMRSVAKCVAIIFIYFCTYVIYLFRRKNEMKKKKTIKKLALVLEKGKKKNNAKELNSF